MEKKTYLIPGQKKKFNIIIVISSLNSLSTTKSQNPNLVYFGFFKKLGKPILMFIWKRKCKKVTTTKCPIDRWMKIKTIINLNCVNKTIKNRNCRRGKGWGDLGEWHCFTYFDKQGIIYLWVIRKWRNGTFFGFKLRLIWILLFSFFFAILFFVLCFSKIPDLRRIPIHLSCLIILWSGIDP